MRRPLVLVLGLASVFVSACASMGGADDPTASLDNPQVTRRVESNGDTVEEYREAGQLTVVKVTPSRGPTYYLVDRNHDGRPDTANTNDNAPVTYYKLFGW